MTEANSLIQVEDLLRHWALQIAETKQLAGGEQKLVWRIDSAEGPFVLRVYPEFVPPESVRRECRWLAQLAATMQEVPRPIATLNGEVCVQYQGRCAVLAPFVPGTPVDSNRSEHRRAMASTLARIHQVGPTLNRVGSSVHPALRDFDWHSNHWWNINAIERSPDASKLWAKTRPRLSEIPRWLESLNGLPETVIHNDYGVVNVLVQDDTVTGVIDWDWATVDWRMLDVAHAIRTVSKHGWADGLERAHQFLNDYTQSGITLDQDEVAALPIILRLQITWSALYDLGRVCLGRIDDESAKYRMITIDDIERFASDLASSLRGP